MRQIAIAIHDPGMKWWINGKEITPEHKAAIDRIELLEAAMRVIIDAAPEKDDGSLAADIRRIAIQAIQ